MVLGFTSFTELRMLHTKNDPLELFPLTGERRWTDKRKFKLLQFLLKNPQQRPELQEVYEVSDFELGVWFIRVESVQEGMAVHALRTNAPMPDVWMLSALRQSIMPGMAVKKD
jgi:hypothetical protein